MLDEEYNNGMEEKDALNIKLQKLKSDIKRLENILSGGEFGFHGQPPAVAITLTNTGQSSNITEKSHDCLYKDFHKLTELSSKAGNFKIELCSRKLRVNPDEFYVYDCCIQGVTSIVKFDCKFCETLKEPGDECGAITEMEASIIMKRDDPETLANWISTCTKTGDIRLFINGLVEFSSIAQIRQQTLQNLYKRSNMGQLGSNIQSIEDVGVLVVCTGHDGKSLVSITWKIGYCETIKSMSSSFNIEFHENGKHLEPLGVFADLRKTYLKEEMLPLLWEAVVEAFICST